MIKQVVQGYTTFYIAEFIKNLEFYLLLSLLFAYT